MVILYSYSTVFYHYLICHHAEVTNQLLYPFQTKSIHPSSHPRIKYFGLPVSITWPVYRIVNAGRVPLVSVSKGLTSLLSVWNDRHTNQKRREEFLWFVCLLVGCLTSQQHASVSQGRICSDNFTCCHTEIEVADQTFHLTQSQYTDTGPTSPSADPITPGAWQGSHGSASF